MKRASIVAMAALLVLVGCGGEDGEDATVSREAAEGSWRATSFLQGAGDSTPLPGTELTADLTAAGELSGSAGCNGYGGSFETQGSSIAIGPLRATKKACVEPRGIMEQEQAFLSALPRAAEFRIDGGNLVLLTASGAVVARFEPAR